jgi:hypothetical protein
MARKKYQWVGVRLDQFVGCKSNLATNRQTRMIAQYDENFEICGYLNSMNRSGLDDELLKRAKQGLKSLSFFGLTEYQNQSFLLFEKMFNNSLRIEKPEAIANSGKRSSTKVSRYKSSPFTDSVLDSLDKKMLKKITYLNRLDLKLYSYAKKIFFKRLEYFDIKF